jgi:hypothetical protein
VSVSSVSVCTVNISGRFRYVAVLPFSRSAVPPFRLLQCHSAVPPFRPSVLPPFRRSAVPPFRRSAVPPFRRSAVPPFRPSAVPFRSSALPPFLAKGPIDYRNIVHSTACGGFDLSIKSVPRGAVDTIITLTLTLTLTLIFILP